MESQSPHSPAYTMQPRAEDVGGDATLVEAFLAILGAAKVCHSSEFLKCSKYVQPISLESKRKGLFHKKDMYAPQQNGVAERKNRHIAEVARALMSEKNMSPRYWAEAVSIAIYTMNRTPTAAVHDMTPEEKFTGKKPDVSHFKVFGCIAYVHVPDELRTKLDPKAEKMCFYWLFS
ncbi:hypothetical protein L7F22_034845 [Adiantum nelumboides]|nr:hypothetical protein [Adiantum nelumboides]